MIEFNRIYVIESLPVGEEKTGTELHNDLLRWQELRYEGFTSVLVEPRNKSDWNTMMSNILNDTENGGVLPIIHFEIHGSTNKDGLVLASHELVTWSEMRDVLEKINIASRMNLFVTLAVCHGAYLLRGLEYPSSEIRHTCYFHHFFLTRCGFYPPSAESFP